MPPAALCKHRIACEVTQFSAVLPLSVIPGLTRGLPCLSDVERKEGGSRVKPGMTTGLARHQKRKFSVKLRRFPPPIPILFPGESRGPRGAALCLLDPGFRRGTLNGPIGMISDQVRGHEEETVKPHLRVKLHRFLPIPCPPPSKERLNFSVVIRDRYRIRGTICV